MDVEEKHSIAKEKILTEIANLLCSYNWGESLIELAEEKCQFSKNYNQLLFPKGLVEIAIAFEHWQDLQMLAKLSKIGKPEKIRQKIALALEIKIIQVVAKQVILKQNSFFLLPVNISEGFKCMANTCDLIWIYAGDKSTDFNYYTKRTLLLSVYLAARNFYLNDHSANHQDTKEFISTSLDNIINIASLKNRIKLPSKEDIPFLRLFS